MVDFWYVTVGTVIAHGCCTALAVIGGRLLASKISVRHGLQLRRCMADCSYSWGSDFVSCIWSYIYL